MKTTILAAAAVASFGLIATSAQAATCIGGVCTENGKSVTITATATPFSATLTGGAGFKMIDDFNSIHASGFLVTGELTFSGTSGIAAEPKGDGTHYDAVETGNSLTITDTHGYLTAISFYMGSPDGNTAGTASPQNNLTLTVNGGLGPIVLHGPDIWGGPGVESGDGNQDTGFLITYVFSPNSVHSVTFNETGAPAFEIDNVSGISVPEPASWALMIMGFGAAGAMLRGKRRLALPA